MKTYTLIAGANGVGKKSFIGILKEFDSNIGSIINTTSISLASELSVNLYSLTTLSIICDCITRDLSFSHESTLSDDFFPAQTITNIVQLCKKNGYYIRMFYIGIDSMADGDSRQQMNVAHDGTGAINKVMPYIYSHQTVLLSILPYCDEMQFYDNTDGFTKVAEYLYGRLQKAEISYPNWFNELLSNCEDIKVQI